MRPATRLPTWRGSAAGSTGRRRSTTRWPIHPTASASGSCRADIPSPSLSIPEGLLAGGGLFGAQSITTLLELLTLNVSSVDDFDMLPRRFRAVAADIATGEQVVLKRGSLADAMRASATIPLLFKPFELDGRALVDGGIVNRLPTDIARDMGADIIIAVDVGENPARDCRQPAHHGRHARADQQSHHRAELGCRGAPWRIS